MNKYRAHQFLENYPVFDRLSDVYDDDDMLQMAIPALFGPDGLTEILAQSKRELMRRADALFRAPGCPA